MLTTFDEYADKYEHARFERRDGILQMTLHTDGGPMLSSPAAHRELPAAFNDVANDVDNLCVILTGSGDAFWPGQQQDAPREKRRDGDGWWKVIKQGTKLLTNFLDIEVPVIIAVNGPCSRHSELAILSDIVLAAPNALFQDAPHFWNGLVPGDGVGAAWLLALGPNRGRYFLLTGQQLDVREAFDLGVVNEIVSAEDLVPRAWDLAREITKRSPMTLRYTKMLLVAEFRRMLNEQLRHSLALEAAAHMDQGGDLGLLARTTELGDGTGFARQRSDDGTGFDG